MQLIGTKVRSIGLLGAVAACCVLAGDRASASPPPPKFEGFEIVNSCVPDPANVVRDLTVQFFRGAESTGCWTIETTPAATIKLPSLAPGETVKLDMPGLWGVAQIRVTSGIPAIPDDPANRFEIFSDQVDADDVPPAETYTGFTSDAPQGAQPVSPRLEFGKSENTWYATLSGASRWGLHYVTVPQVTRNIP